MAIEIEHKYLVKNDNYKNLATESFRIRQGYLSRDPERTVRVRIKGDKGFLTIKGKNRGAIRAEFEYEIPLDDALQMLTLCQQPVIDKIRHIVPFEGHLWEVDEFLGDKTGLITAEIELKHEDDTYLMPDFIGKNVTGDPHYYNSNI